jgi:hypothetical protein
VKASITDTPLLCATNTRDRSLVGSVSMMELTPSMVIVLTQGSLITAPETGSV